MIAAVGDVLCGCYCKRVSQTTQVQDEVNRNNKSLPGTAMCACVRVFFVVSCPFFVVLESMSTIFRCQGIDSPVLCILSTNFLRVLFFFFLLRRRGRGTLMFLFFSNIFAGQQVGWQHTRTNTHERTEVCDAMCAWSWWRASARSTRTLYREIFWSSGWLTFVFFFLFVPSLFFFFLSHSFLSSRSPRSGTPFFFFFVVSNGAVRPPPEL